MPLARVAEVAGLQKGAEGEGEAEFLVMKAVAKGLVRATIDGVEGTVHVSFFFSFFFRFWFWFFLEFFFFLLFFLSFFSHSSLTPRTPSKKNLLSADHVGRPARPHAAAGRGPRREAPLVAVQGRRRVGGARGRGRGRGARGGVRRFSFSPCFFLFFEESFCSFLFYRDV